MLDRWPDVRVPFVPQLEDADCGPACLSAVMSVHGIRESVARLAQRCETGRDGTGMAGLAAAADEFGLRATPLRVRAEADLSRALGGIPMPVIAPITGHHFVVIEQVTSREVRVMDPAVGHRRESIDWLKENFGGIVLAVMPGRTDGHPGRPVPNWAALVAWRTWRTAGTERGQAQAGVLPVVREEVSSTRGMLAIGICASVIAAGLGLLGPIIARRWAFTPDDAAPSGPAAALALVAAAAVGSAAGNVGIPVIDCIGEGYRSGRVFAGVAVSQGTDHRIRGGGRGGDIEGDGERACRLGEGADGGSREDDLAASGEGQCSGAGEQIFGVCTA